MKRLYLPVAILTALAAVGYSDSVFDIMGVGRDVVPAVGSARSLAGAVGASNDPLTASVMAPFASALAERVTVGAGFSHVRTRSNNISEERETITTLFPSLAVIVPVRKVSILTGLFLEKEGRISLDYTGTYMNTVYDVSYRKEASIHTVPLYVSGRPHPRLVLSGGILASFFDTRAGTKIDFRSSEYADADDVSDIYATGTGLAAGFLLDLDKVRVGALYRTKCDLDGTVERSNEPAGIWSRTDIGISSHESFKVSLRFQPLTSFFIEADYDRSPWERLKIGQASISDMSVERLALGAQYRGTRLWNASKYPLNAGFYRQPLDWKTDSTGDIIEQVVAFGTSIPMGTDRASFSVAFEYGWREAENEASLSETFLGVSVSISAIETWQREIKR